MSKDAKRDKKINKWNICRTCGTKADIDIFSTEGEELQLADKINTYLPITVSIDDKPLPLKMCSVCIGRLESCHRLIVSTIEMHNILENDMKRKKVKNNSHHIKSAENNYIESTLEAQNIQIEEVFDGSSADLEDLGNLDDLDDFVENYNNITVQDEQQKDKQNTEYETVDVYNVSTDEHCDDDSDSDVIITECNSENNVESKCLKCQRIFSTGRELRRHIIILHDPAEMECFHCFATFDSLLHFERHVTSHYSENEYMCDFCPSLFNRMSALLDHLDKHKINHDSLICGVCGKELFSRIAFNIHKQTHSDKKPHMCRYCSRTFSQMSSKNHHERTHIGETTHPCEFCSKGFNTKLARDTHRRIHTGERPFTCELCNATFRCLANLRQHNVIHQKVKPFQCDVCFKRFGRPENVRIHMRVHTGEKPYKCLICCRGFTQKNDMLKHMNVHNKTNGRLHSKGPKNTVDTVRITVNNSAHNCLNMNGFNILSFNASNNDSDSSDNNNN